MCIGPQAYAYAGGNPLKNIDPTGRYYLDSTWRGGTTEYAVAEAGLRQLRENWNCKCTFKVVFGRVPYSDPYPIRLGTSVEYVDPTNYEPYQPAGHTVYAGETGAGLTLTGRVEIGNLPFNSDVDEFQKTLAHEMVHLSFGVRGHYENGERNPEWIERAWGGDFSNYSEGNQKKIQKCLECK
jgi:hypothetical protein